MSSAYFRPAFSDEASVKFNLTVYQNSLAVPLVGPLHVNIATGETERTGVSEE